MSQAALRRVRQDVSPSRWEMARVCVGPTEVGDAVRCAVQELDGAHSNAAPAEVPAARRDVLPELCCTSSEHMDVPKASGNTLLPVV